MENEFRSYQDKLNHDFKQIKKDLREKNPTWSEELIDEEASEVMRSRKPIESFIRAFCPEILPEGYDNETH